MANVNAGTQVRFENGGQILIGTKIVLNISEGTLKFKVSGREPIVPMDRGVIQAPLPGDERLVEGSVDLAYTSPIDTDGILPELVGALVSNKISNVSSGNLFTFAMTVKVPDYLGATTGDQYVFAACFLDPVVDYQAQSGANTDRLSFSFKDAENSPTITRY